jgi:biopolymer transport protein ExbD
MPFKSSQNRVIIPVVEMTPMIDIVFLLIIFFMVAAQFAQQARVDVALPQEFGEDINIEIGSLIIINVLDNNDIILDSNIGAISLSDLDLELKHRKEINNLAWENVKIRSDGSSSSGTLNDIVSLLSKHGLKATIIATKEP